MVQPVLDLSSEFIKEIFSLAERVMDSSIGLLNGCSDEVSSLIDLVYQ